MTSFKSLYLEADRERKKLGGRPRTFETPDEIWDAAMKYFEWATDTYVIGRHLVMDGKNSHIVDTESPRIFSMQGFLAHAIIPRSTWDDYRARDEFKEVTELITLIVRTQKFDGSAAGIFNSPLVIRDLELKDAKTLEASGPDGKPLDMGVTINMVPVGVDGE